MIQTRPRTRWVIQMGLMTVLCAVFGVWGWYDYSVKIPLDELGYQKKVAFSNVKAGLEAHANSEANALQTAADGIKVAAQQLTDSMTKSEAEELRQARGEMQSQFKEQMEQAQQEGLVSATFNFRSNLGTVARERLSWTLQVDRMIVGLALVDQGEWTRDSDAFANFVDGVSEGVTAYQKFPVPNKWNRMVQWLFILCGPYSLFTAFQLIGGLRRKYSVDEEGAFHHPEGTWLANEITDIDMSRWMSKSVAKVIHTDGRIAKIDDYIHQDADKIIGEIAHRLRPSEWTDHAKAVSNNSPSDETDTASDEASQE
ncbi:MAG: hypothetical protein CMJ28_02505 [Phycisphaerae bacterium]|nr:hypothetical protein [Phycisphaerae bacterium]